MKWNEWTTVRQKAEKLFGKGVIRRLGDNLIDQSPDYIKSVSLTEDVWIALSRPYFSVWPVALRALLKVKLDIPTDCVKLPLPSVVMKFGEGFEPEQNGYKLRSMLLGAGSLGPSEDGRDGVSFLQMVAEFTNPLGKQQLASVVSLLHPGITVERSLQLVQENEDRIQADVEKNSPELLDKHLEKCIPPGLDVMCARLACGLCLLADDPSLITRDVLVADQHKVAAASPEQLERLVDKAVRRGKRGFSVGASWEQIPHYRRPHFGIRWYGPREGQQTAKLVAISGAIVHRNKLSDVPTGYEDEEVEA